MIATLRHRAGEEIQDRYLVLNELGAGAFGTVYQCRDRELGLTVAVKELHVLDDPSTALNERVLALDQFRREAIHLSELRHPHIVSGHYQPHSGTWLVCPTCGLPFRGVSTCPEHNALPVVIKQRHYLVMEYIGGPDIEAAAQQAGGTLPIKQTIRAAQQVVDALIHIHERGWVHRDIKPENIRLRIKAASNGSSSDAASVDAVLLDFGIATQSGVAGVFSTRPQKKTTGGGTWGYAPDDPRERVHPDARSDIHALGMTLYRVLTDRDPTEPAHLIEMRRSRPSQFNPRIPPGLDELIVRCIAADPRARPKSTRDIAHALVALEFGVISPPAPAVAPPSTYAATPAAPNAPVAPPTAAFTFSNGEVASNLTQLVKLCDKHTEEASDYLFNGDIANWLRATNRHEEARRSDEIRVQYAEQRKQGLEAFIQYTGVLEPPGLKITPQILDFGTLWLGQKRAVDVFVNNPGRGHLFGLVRTRYTNLSFPQTFDGNSNVLPVVLDSRGLQRGTYEGDVEIDTSGGEVRVPFRFTLHRRRSSLPFWHVFLASLCGALSAMLARTLPFAGGDDGKITAWLAPGAEFGQLGDKASMSGLFAGCVWVALIALFAFEGLRRKSLGIFFSGALSSALLAAACFGGATMILPAIDQSLQSWMQPIVKNWPPGAWMLMGGLGGAIYGTVSRWKDLLTTRAGLIVGAWVAAIVVIYAMLAGLLLAMQTASVG